MKIGASALLIVFLALSLSLSFPSVFATYNIQPGASSVKVEILDDVRQGVPNPAANDSRVFTEEIPKVSFILTGANASDVESALSLSVRSKSPQATVGSLYLQVSSNGSWVHIDMRFDVLGVVSGSQEFKRADLSWRSFLLTENFKVGNFSYNLLGSTYFAEPVGFLSEPSGLPVANVRRWYFNGLARTPGQVAADVGSMSLFNFSSLSKPLENWRREFDLGGVETRLSSIGGFNLTFLGTIREPGEEFTQAINAVYSPQVLLKVHGLAEAKGDVLYIDTGNGYPPESFMLTIVFAVALLGLATFMYERRVQRRPTVRKERLSRNRRSP